VAAAVLAAGGCALPVMAWPEWPAGVDRTIQIERPDGTPASGGYVLLRVVRYDSSGTAEGDRTVRNQQVLDAAFGYRRAVRVNPKPDVRVRHRLVEMLVLPIGSGGVVELPTVTYAGSRWIILEGPRTRSADSERPKARSGVHPRVHFAEIQAFLPGLPPSTRAEVTADLYLLRLQAAEAPVAWRQELEYARSDVARLQPRRYVLLEFLDRELARLRGARPAAFVPDGVGVPRRAAASEEP
jgi:hypothetical protein